MSKAVLLSIRPEWCGKIASGEKTIEVRKTRPKLQTPFRCYIYCTGDTKTQFWIGRRYSYADDHSHNIFDRCGNGKIIGEFVCDEIKCGDAFDFVVKEDGDMLLKGTCLTKDDLYKYLGWKHGAPRADAKPFYRWHISNLIIYDTPKPVVCPPQSWCYVEESNR